MKALGTSLSRLTPLLAALALLRPAPASACGGCFILQESSGTVVTGHRMAVSISPTQTVLWDQIEYAGDPAEFSWVLPVKPGAVLELADPAFFDALEATTQARVSSPPVYCSRGRGCSFGCSASNAGAVPEEEGGGPVTVVSQAVIGPYETVTLSTSTPGALNTWLSDHGYAVDATTQPIIDAYVDEGFDFIALRLAPGQGVRAMKPVRVVTEGANPTFPLRMVAAGTGALTDVVLYVIGEGRWAAQGFADVDVLPGDLVWNFDTSSSNFAELRKAALAQNGGKAFMTSFARRGTLLDPNTGTYVLNESTGQTASSFPAIYSALLPPGSGCNVPMLESLAVSPDVVVQDCDVDGSCFPVANGQLPASSFACGEGSDLARAMVGLHPSDVWVTRLEGSLPRAALAEDLSLGAAPVQAQNPGLYVAASAIGSDPCAASVAPPPATLPAWLRDAAGGAGAAIVGLGLLLARRRRGA